MKRLVLLLLAVLSSWSLAGAGDTMRQESAGLRYAMPRDWTRVPAPSDMRAAQYQIPRAAGDSEDGELILFFFGTNQGGGVEDNLQRWYRQFVQPDGRKSEDAAVLTKRTVGALKVTAVDLSGTYTPMAQPGAPATAAKSGYRMLAAVVEGPGGPWFWKGVGPEKTMAAAKAAFDAMLLSVEPHS
jgi:hypothetical protein